MVPISIISHILQFNPLSTTYEAQYTYLPILVKIISALKLAGWEERDLAQPLKWREEYITLRGLVSYVGDNPEKRFRDSLKPAVSALPVMGQA